MEITHNAKESYAQHWILGWKKMWNIHSLIHIFTPLINSSLFQHLLSVSQENTEDQLLLVRQSCTWNNCSQRIHQQLRDLSKHPRTRRDPKSFTECVYIQNSEAVSCAELELSGKTCPFSKFMGLCGSLANLHERQGWGKHAFSSWLIFPWQFSSLSPFMMIQHDVKCLVCYIILSLLYDQHIKPEGVQNHKDLKRNSWWS